MGRESREIWAKRVERWRDSGLSVKEFAQEIGVNANTLAGWRWRLGPGGRRSAETELRRSVAAVPATDVRSVEFVELIRPVVDERFEVVTANGRTVRVPTRFDDAALARLLAVVERA